MVTDKRILNRIRFFIEEARAKSVELESLHKREAELEGELKIVRESIASSDARFGFDPVVGALCELRPEIEAIAKEEGWLD